MAEAGRTRSAIIDRGVQVASVEGLEGLTIGRLAADLQMSKSGVLGHFGTKESLQLAVLDAAAQVFTAEVPKRARGARSGMPRLLALCAAWVSYLERGVFPGGCFINAAALEFDDRGGPVRDAVAGFNSAWQDELGRHVRIAAAAGDLPPETDADQVVFELNGQMLALNVALQLHRDRAAPDRTRRAMSHLLGHPVLPVAAATADRS